jgi:ribonuclease HI
MKEIATVRFLGQCLPRNPGGIACYAYVIRSKEGHLLHEACGLAAEPNSSSSTNSVASYTALIKALEWLIKNHYTNDIIKVYGNSKLVISQINDIEVASNNNNRISKNTLPLYAKAMKLKSKFYYISFELTTSNNNKHIDDKEVEELSVLAYVEAKTKILERNRSSSSNNNNNSYDKSKQEQNKKLFSTAEELMMAAK